MAALLGLLVFTGVGQILGQVTLNEFMAVNTRTLVDQDREYSDWIELYNAGSQPVNLAGWYLTDAKGNLAKWAFPSTPIASGGFVIVFASGKDRAVPGQELHASFKLGSDGGYLALVEPDGTTIASEFAPAYPRQFGDVSYGRYQGTNVFFTKPTPGAVNGPGLEGATAGVKFSQKRGFYQAPFNLEITTDTPGASVRWATNGAPPSATNGFLYAGPIPILGTTVMRAMAFKDGFLTSRVDTATFVFVEDVIRQSANGKAPVGWPTSWGANTVDYGMDQSVVNSAAYSSTIKADLQTIPSFSIVTELGNLFDSRRGIYANASQQGIAWERPCSLELIFPDGRDGFQIEAGLRARGGYSRSGSNPKHAFRVFFRPEYGDAKLHYPMFASQGGAESFSGFDIRTFQNYSWSFEGDTRGVFMRDQFSRDTQIDMGLPAERGDYYHLYLDGQYWGLYNSDERPEADYAASYFGGSSGDYDVIKVESGPYTIKATDGTMDAWTRLYTQAKAGLATDAAYQKLQGNNPDGTPNPDYEVLLDVDNLIDYMLVILYGGNLDAPISNFIGNTNPNNWYGIRNRYGREGFRFFCHDSEHTLLNVNEDRTGPYAAGNSSVLTSSPQWVFQKLWVNTEFKIRLADHVQRHFFNGGALTPEAAAARFLKRKNEIDRAVVGESARWGNAKRSPALTRNDWLNTVNSILNDYFPRRGAIVLQQLSRKGLFPTLAAPVFSQFGGPIDRGFRLSISPSTGTVYYTLDGSDPRVRGGDVSAGAQPYGAPITLNESLLVRARALQGTNWSALTEARFTLIQTFTNLVISEIMYRPLGESNVSADNFEFIELKNLEPVEIDVSGVYFTNGIRYVFSTGARLAPGQFVVLANNATNFAARYPGVRVDGVFSGNLANNGETLTLAHAIGTTLFSMTYSDQAPWPRTADGQGFSLVPVNPNANLDPNDPAHWRASSSVGGSPGADDVAGTTSFVVINEILTRTDAPQLDTIELHNPGASTADIGNWYLTDDRNQPKKYRIPAGTSIAPAGYALFDETQFHAEPAADTSFRLDALGGEVFLYSADAAGNLTGYSDGFTFGAAARGVTFGRHTNSAGEIQYPAQREATLGGPNSGPRVGPVVINEIQYHPAAGDAEFVELKNITDTEVPLYDAEHPTNTWRLNGLGFDFPAGTVIPSQGLVLLVGGSPAVFRTRYQVPTQVAIFGPYPGALQDNGELLELERPDAPRTDSKGALVVPYVVVDAVRYGDRAPWPANAAGQGMSLERIRSDVYGNDPANWRASFGPPSPGLANDGNRMPTVNAGLDQELQAASFPAMVNLQGVAADDGLPDPPQHLVTAWTQTSGPGPVVIANPNRLDTAVGLPGVGSYTLRLTVDDGALQASDEVIVTARRPASAATFIAVGSVWKYFDKGSDLGTAWRGLAFTDNAWSAGKGQLGYGDGDEATVVGYGPDSNNKYVTTYFRRAFEVMDAKSVTALKVKLLRDDGAIVYLNGTEVVRDNMPEGDINYTTYASAVVSGDDETTNFFEHDIDPALLREGANELAVEIHQANASSSDISFDLELSGQAYPANRAPSAMAGEDQVVTLPDAASLKGTFNDDGLPNPPGVVTAIWSVVGGPGPVVITETNRLVTTASFSQPGSYTLRLTVDDGAYPVSDDLTIVVKEGVRPPLRIASAELVGGPPPRLRIRFLAEAGQTYTVQSRDSLAAGDWETLQDVATPAGADTVEFIDPSPAEKSNRYYRLLRQ